MSTCFIYDPNIYGDCPSLPPGKNYTEKGMDLDFLVSMSHRGNGAPHLPNGSIMTLIAV